MSNQINTTELQSSIVLYTTPDGVTQLDVKLENETVWLTQAQMALLFETTPQNITMHIRNIYKVQELPKDSTCKDFLQVQTEGNRQVSRSTKMAGVLNMEHTKQLMDRPKHKAT